jgi:hypothetical protein
MTSTSRLRAALPVLLLALAATGVPASATTIVPVSDPLLVDQAPVVLVGRVEGKMPNTTANPVTNWLVTVEQVLKGQVDDGSIVVRVLGGATADGETLTIYGAPRFAQNEQVLLFLAPRPDGAWAIHQYLQGAFHVIAAGGRTVAMRDLSEVEVVTGRRRARRTPLVRDFELFRDWISDRVAGLNPSRNYMFRPTQRQLSRIRPGFTLFESDGLNMRWFEFDSGTPVNWLAHQDGQPGLTGGGFAEFQRALQAWNNEPTTPINLAYAGTTTASAGFTRFDNRNVLLFNDPNQEIEGTFDCAQGGTVAIGGPWSDSSVTGRFDGRTFIRIQGGDVVMNDGIQCLFSRSPNASKFMEEVVAHEVGHTLGLGHSSENPNEPSALLRQALMYYRAHDDGRGARLNSDDVAGLQALYKRGSHGGGGNGSCPADTLCMQSGRFQVTATWSNQFNGSSGSAGVQKASDLSGYLYFTDPRNIELIVKILDFGDVVKVFWGQLTNLHYTISVVDTHTGLTKTYTNTPGDCGGFDNNGFVSGAIVARVARSVHGRVRPTPAAACHADADTMCLLGGRFAVEMTWRNQYNNTSGVGIPTRLSDLTGAFAFTDPKNLEILLKTLDFGDRILVIYGSLSNLEYTLRVTDVLSGTVKTYSNPAGQYCGGLDNNAF